MTLERLPRTLLHLEGLAVLAGSLVLYFEAGHGWIVLLALFLAPDISMLGYLGGSRLGALAYDAVHTYALPIGLGALGVVLGSAAATQIALIWLAHIGMDRLLGYGLKYPGGFRSTHLQRV